MMKLPVVLLLVSSLSVQVSADTDCCLCDNCEMVPMELSDKVLIDGATGAFSTCDELMLNLWTDSKEGDLQCTDARNSFSAACCGRAAIDLQEGRTRRSLWSWSSSNWSPKPAPSYNSFSSSNSIGWGNAPSFAPVTKPAVASFSFPARNPSPAASFSSSSATCNAGCPTSSMTAPCRGVHFNGFAAQPNFVINAPCSSVASAIRSANAQNCQLLKAVIPATCGCPGASNNAAQFFNTGSSKQCLPAGGNWGIKGN